MSNASMTTEDDEARSIARAFVRDLDQLTLGLYTGLCATEQLPPVALAKGLDLLVIGDMGVDRSELAQRLLVAAARMIEMADMVE